MSVKTHGNGTIDPTGPTKPRVCLMGASLETGNMGVSALALSLIKNILKVRPDASISLLVGNKIPLIRNVDVSGKKVPVNVINYRLSPRAKISEHLVWILALAILHRLLPFQSIRERIIHSNAWLRELHEATFIGDIHGGDSFSDIYGFVRFFWEALPDMIVFLMQRDLVLLPQTFGPYRSSISRYLASFIITRSRIITVRDRTGVDFVKKMLGKQASKDKVTFCPDVAFTLDSRATIAPMIHPPIDGECISSLIGININGLLYNGGYNRGNMFALQFDYRSFISHMVTTILDRTSSDILLIPHTYGTPGSINNDLDASEDVIKSIPTKDIGRIHLLAERCDPPTLKYHIRKCNFFVGSRMHACIAAISQGVPAVAVAYSAKFKGVFASVGVGEYVADAHQLKMAEVVEKVLLCYHHRDRLRHLLERQMTIVSSQIEDTFKYLFALPG